MWSDEELPGQRLEDGQSGDMFADMVSRGTERLDDYQKEMAETFLKEEHSKFVTGSSDLGRTNLIPHKINTGDA